MSGGDGSVTQTVPNDGTRALFQPPFIVRGLIINNRSNQPCTVVDGRAGQWTARAGATARFVPKSADSNYIAQLAAAATSGECQVTFTPYPIEETGEPAVAGPLDVAQLDYTLPAGNEIWIATQGAIAVDLALAESSSDPTQATNVRLEGAVVPASTTVTIYAPIVAGSILYLPHATTVSLRVGAGSTIPLPQQIHINNLGPGGLVVRAILRTQ